MNNIIFLYGPPATAKTYAAKEIAKQTGYKYLDLDAFYLEHKVSTDVQKLNKLMQYLQSNPNNWIIDSFLDTKAQTVVFFEHFGKPRYVIYFQSTKDEIEENIRILSTPELKKQRFSRFQTFLKERDDLIAYLKKYSFFVTVNAIQQGLSNKFIQSAPLIVESIMQLLRPKVMVAFTYNNEDLADTYMEKLEKELKYIHLHVETLCEDEYARNTPLGKQIGAFISSGQVIPAPMQIELLRKEMYSDPQRNQFLLTSFPEKSQEFKIFEQEMFPIDGLISFMKPGRTLAYSAKENPVLHYITSGKHLIINNEELGVFQSFITKRTKFGMITGPLQSGRTTFLKHIGLKFGYQIIEWEATINMLKEKLAPNVGEPLDEVTLPQIIGYYKQLFGTYSQEKYVFDGYPPMCDKPELIEQFNQIGQFSWFLNIQITPEKIEKIDDLKHYWTRYKIKNELDAAQEITPEDEEKLKGQVGVNVELLKQIQQYILQSSDCKLFQLDTQNSLELSLKAVDQIFEKRVYLASVVTDLTPQIKESLKLVYVNIAAKNNMNFVDVPDLIAQNIGLLENDYEMRWSKQEKSNPSNFQPEKVLKLIKQHLDSLSIQSRDVILWGYTSADQKGEKQAEELIFPRASDELVVVEKNLGIIKVLYAITNDLMNSEIQDPEWILEKPEVPVVKQEGEGGEDEPKDPEPANDDEENKPKFNKYEYQWTKSETSKNMAQIFMKIKQPNSVNLEVSDYSFKMIYDNFDEVYQSIQENNEATYFTQIQLQQPVMD